MKTKPLTCAEHAEIADDVALARHFLWCAQRKCAGHFPIKHPVMRELYRDQMVPLGRLFFALETDYIRAAEAENSWAPAIYQNWQERVERLLKAVT